MPKTKFEAVVFTAIMDFCMVFCMTLYAIADKMGGLQYSTFLIAIREMWIEYVIGFILIFFVISRLAMYLAKKTVGDVRHPLVMTLAIQCFTVCFAVPSITLIVTFLQNGIYANWFVDWITMAVKCFPMALCLQIFFIGPFVRKIFSLIFRREKN